MDTSELYIKMCDCPEIQEQWEPESGDWIAEKYQDQWDVSMAHMCNIFELKKDKKKITTLIYEGWDTFNEYKNPIWLPTQDQIQAMLPENNCRCLCCLIVHLNKFIEENLSGLADVNIDTMEQYWLAFYMSEKHKKFWGKDGWEDK